MNICEDIRDLIKDNLSRICALRDKKRKKEDDSYVSEGDLLCESLVKNYITTQCPEFYIVSEETPSDNKHHIKHPHVVILDPIDGTENFVSGLKEWGVAVCVYENGIHKQSMLALPELNCYLISGDTPPRFQSRIAGLSSSLTKEDLLQLEPGFEYRIIGCCVYNMYNAIIGAYHSFENPKGALIWDIIPGLNLALEHGLNVTINNKPYHGELLEADQRYRFKIWQN